MIDAAARPMVRAILLDLLMATMDSISTWATAAGDRGIGLAWRDAVTARMMATRRYTSYDGLVTEAAGDLRLPNDAPRRLRDAWLTMARWPDAEALEDMRLPFGFVTNCSVSLAAVAVERSGLQPAFTLTAEEACWYKPQPDVYRLGCERFGTDPVETRFVAGAPYDALGASSVGLPTVLVARRPLEQRVPAEIRVVSSLEDALAGL